MNNLHSLLFVFLSLLFIRSAFSQTSVDFNSDKTSGCGAISNVQFNDLSTGTINSWNWDFGNGNTSTLQNPVASYASAGTYTVSLTVSGPNGSLTETKNAYITVFPKPIADFQLSISNGCQPLKVDFTDASNLGNVLPDEYIWDFGDGSPENKQQNPSYTYQYPGNYIVSLQIVDANGCSDAKDFNSIDVVERPQAIFSSYNSPNNCSAPHTVNFANYTSGGPGLTYFWDFGDGNTSSLKEPVHTYANMGKYDVTLVTMNNLCADTTKIIGFVSLEPISANYTLLKNDFCFGDSIHFKGITTGASNYHWDFGDGTTSSRKDPVKLYSDSGKFAVTLTASSGPNCVAAYTDSIYIKKIVADFIVEDTFCMIPQTVNFVNNSIYGDNIFWAFPDTSYSDTNGIMEITKFGKYYVSLSIEDTTVGCESEHSTIIVNYNPAPTIQHDGVLKGCIPRTESFEYVYNRMYDSVSSSTWYIPELNDSASGNKFSYTFTQAGKFTVILKTVNTRGCISYDSVKVVAGDSIPVPSLNLEDTLCFGEHSYFLAPNMPLTDSLRYYYGYFQYPIPSLLNDSDFYVNTFTLDTVYYHVSDTGKWYIGHRWEYYGCPNLVLDSFYVNGPIASTYASRPCDTIDSTNVYTLYGHIHGDYSTFKWELEDGTFINSSSLVVTDTFPDDSTNIFFIAFNQDSTCNDTSTVHITHARIPKIAMNGRANICLGDTAEFSTSMVYPSDTMRWYINDSLVGMDINKYKIYRDTPEKLDLKIVLVDKYGCSDVVESEVSFSEIKADFELEYGKSCIPFPLTIKNTSVSTYFNLDTMYWDLKPWGLDTSIGLAQLTKQVGSDMTISGQLIATDFYGCTDTVIKEDLLVAKNNNLNFWVANKNICLGDTVYFENFSALNEPYYLWEFGDGDSSIGYDAKHVYTQPGQYNISMKYLNDTLCEQFVEQKNYITVEAKPLADFTADITTATCYPLPVTFQDLSNDPNIVSWEWDFGDGVQSAFQHPFHNYLNPGKYDVSLIVTTGNGCTDSIIKPEFIQTTGPTADFSIFPDTGCIYDNFNFRIANLTNTTDFQWDFGDGNFSLDSNTSHRYSSVGKKYPYLIISDSSGNCTVPIVDSVYVVEAQAIFDVSDLEVCVGEIVSFQNFSIGANQLSWDFDDGSSSNISNPTHSFSTPGTYQVKLEITGLNDCIDDSIQSILVNPAPVLSATIDTSICFGDSIQLNVSGGIIYTWTPTDSLSDPSVSNPIAFPDTFTSYKVVVQNQFGCMDSTEVNIDVHHPPVHSVFQDTNLVIGESIFIHAASNPGFIYSWTPDLWLSCGNCQDPLAQPLKTTTYVLNVHDVYGCFSIYDTIHIEVKEAYSVSVPNAFSPNGDGNNDVIYVRGWGIKDLLEFKIYNRWGEVVFESTELSSGWDGIYKEELQNVDTYIYTVKALMWNQEVWTDKGNISLLR